jgi:hypothetical protein
MRLFLISILSFFLVSFLILPAAAADAKVDLAWDANTEPDLDGYKIYYGLASGNYGTPVDVGNVEQHTLTGLEEGKTYFLAATAYDLDGNESAFSDELVHNVPFSIPGQGEGFSYKDIQRRFEW